VARSRTLETGAVVLVPLFVQQGEVVKVDTDRRISGTGGQVNGKGVSSSCEGRRHQWTTIAARRLEAALGQIEPQFAGRRSLRMGADDPARDVDVISTGSLALDVALGIGGCRAPRGRDLRPESSGRPRCACRWWPSAEAWRRRPYIDAENALDPGYAEKLGVKVSDTMISQPDTGEQGLEIADMLCASNSVDVIVIDSVAALGEVGNRRARWREAQVGVQAAPDVAGAAQAHLQHQARQCLGDLHQQSA